MSTSLAIATTLAAACSSTGAADSMGLGGVRSQSVLRVDAAPATGPAHGAEAREAATATAPPVLPMDEPEDAAAVERQLRHELANAGDPTEAALELADLLCALERHREALVAIDVALERTDAAPLRICRAGVLRDLGRRREAADELCALAARDGPGALHPALLFECAELQWLAGDATGAAATLRSIDAAHADDPWCDRNRRALDGLTAELRTRAAPRRIRVRDLLADLRSAGTTTDRIGLLTDLCRLADAETGARREHLRSRAVAIACADESPAVRARAVQLAEPPDESVEPFCRAALADDDPLVRRVTAERCTALAGAASVPWLLEAIASETDPAAFVAMHTALARSVPDGPSLFEAAAHDAATRAGVVAAWRERCRH